MTHDTLVLSERLYLYSLTLMLFMNIIIIANQGHKHNLLRAHAIILYMVKDSSDELKLAPTKKS